jgi:protease IV
MSNLPPYETGPMAAPPPPPRPFAAAPKPPRRHPILSILLVILLVLSVAANGMMILALVVMGGMVGGAELEDTYVEKVVEKGPASEKIAVIRIEGVIDQEMAANVHGQLLRASRDSNVKAVLIRINSPGGGLTASDMIHHDIDVLLGDRPVVASMDAVAASGGYYIACAADHIVAQETTITGSIGVIAQMFFLNGLLTDKLGVNVLTLKCGEQKDVPNMFAAGMTPDQQKYLQTTLLDPGFARFKDIVAEGRNMKPEAVDAVATGRIFLAKEAKEKKLIDQIGYFEDAVEEAKARAKLKKARVVEYVQPFRLAELLGLQAKTQNHTILTMTPERLAEMASPKVMYLWTGY